MPLSKIEKYLEEINRLIKEENYSGAAFVIESLDPPIIYHILIRLDDEVRLRLFAFINLHAISSLLNKLPENILYEIMFVKGVDEINKVLQNLRYDEIADVLDKIPPKFKSKIIELFPVNIKNEVLKLLKYPPESVGGVMTPQVPVFNHNMRVEDAINTYITKDKLGLYDKHQYIYVVDEDNKFLGWIDVKSFLTKPRDLLLNKIIQRCPMAIRADRDREDAARMAVLYDLSEVPVVDKDNKFLGAVTLDDILDVVVHEFSEDLLKHGGLLEVIRGSYIVLNPLKLALKRAPMIIYLYFMNAITGGIVASFENIIARVAIIAAFLPMLADNSGNIGSQASSIIIRSMILGEIKCNRIDFMKVVIKEFMITTMMLLFLLPTASIIGFTITFLTIGDFSMAIKVTFVVGVALAVSSYVSDIVGSSLPFLLIKIKLDPAVVSAPLITTIADILTVLSYFLVATFLLGI
ncbi:MAG: magnesium transporter [Candidatus Methanomethyliaceae archaeon]|nr:magnesium transporter [Candidatus Methanomethyliaceae archaeon]MDW7970536.1 magnesium transporter [Nitrososphaerota archaeon]